jgi:hypothetical protein
MAAVTEHVAAKMGRGAQAAGMVALTGAIVSHLGA